MTLNAARLPTRINASGDLMPLSEQDRSQWDRRLIEEGVALLALAAEGPKQAPITWRRRSRPCMRARERQEDTDWARIVWLYDMLMAVRPGPVVALNRAIAIAHRDGPESGLVAIRAIEEAERLAAYPFLPAALGDLELGAAIRPRRGSTFTTRSGLRAALPSGSSTPDGSPPASSRGQSAHDGVRSRSCSPTGGCRQALRGAGAGHAACLVP